MVHITNALIAAVLAPGCAVCASLLDEPLSGCVCNTCWSAIRPITPPLCDRCGDPLPRLNMSARPHCPAGSTVARSRAIGGYEGTLREIIHALKSSRRHSLARQLAQRMRAHGSDVLDSVDCVVPVPLHWRREYRRGFNQAREIARHLGPPMVDGLVRLRATRPQIELAAHFRKTNVDGAFAVRRRWFRNSAFDGRRVLLVDDVSTTGATLDACARILKEAGAIEVFALTAARVVTTLPGKAPPGAGKRP